MDSIFSQEHRFKLSSLIHNRRKIVTGLSGFYSILNVQLLKYPTFYPEIGSVSCNLLFIKLKHIKCQTIISIKAAKNKELFEGS